MRSQLLHAYHLWKESRENGTPIPGVPQWPIKVDFKPIEQGQGCFLILCDGGLCNRLNSLIVGYYAARALNRAPVIVWPETAVCDCALEKLLVAPEGVEVVREFDWEAIRKPFGIWHFHLRGEGQIHPRDVKSWRHLQQILPEGEVVYGNNLLVKWVDVAGAFALYQREFALNAWVQREIEGFIEKERVRDAVGMHFRTTDFDLTFESYGGIFQKALRTGRRVFVCSDAEETERQALASSGRLFRRDKSAYVDKQDGGLPWSEGETYNVYRSEKAIIDAMIDLYLLSATRRQFGNAASTFFNFARYLRY